MTIYTTCVSIKQTVYYQQRMTMYLAWFPENVVYFPEKEGMARQGMWHAGGKEKVHTGLLWGEPMERDALGKSRSIWGHNIKMDLQDAVSRA